LLTVVIAVYLAAQVELPDSLTVAAAELSYTVVSGVTFQPAA
jgi:hypothetical protein